MNAAAAPTVRVVIADDHRLFAEALEAILDSEARLQVVGRATDGREAVERARELRPDVVLLDISMPVMDGFEATRQIRASGSTARIVVLTGSDSRADVVRAQNAGADAFVAKARITSDLLDAIVASGG